MYSQRFLSTTVLITEGTGPVSSFRSYHDAFHSFLFLALRLQEGSQASSSLAALQAERDVLLHSAREKDAEISSLRQQAQQQQGSLDLERDRLNRELEALRAQLQQQVPTV